MIMNVLVQDHFPSIIVRMCVILITFLHISLNVVPMAVIGIQVRRKACGEFSFLSFSLFFFVLDYIGYERT